MAAAPPHARYDGSAMRALSSTILVVAATLGSCARPHTPPAAHRAAAGVAPASIDAATTVIIHVPAEVMAADSPETPPDHASRRAEDERRRVRESVGDLARVLRETTRARVVVDSTDETKEHDERTYRIFVGQAGERRHGSVGVTAPYGQGFRLLVADRLASLYGESGLATSYAIYELLHRIGCRWFFPGPLGEVLPPQGPIGLPATDERRTPSTVYRGVWYADDAWKRRNRQGGLHIEAGHALELVYVTEEDRTTHPEWVATVGGRRHPHRLRWSSDTLADHVGERILALHRRDRAPSYSLSPDDGTDFDDSPEDRALDAGDVDPTLDRTSITDRYLHFANRIASRVAAQEPDVLLGFLAYAQYTRPPLRERVHRNLVPEIAPITYARAHPMNDDSAPGNAALRHIVERWGQLSRGTSIYFYGYFLAEPSAPNPMLTKWGHDVPFVLANNARYWQPETFPNFETSMHALYMGMRLAFDARLKPDDVYADIDAKLYGAAGPTMHAYWKEVDRAWIETKEYSGGIFGHSRRFTPERLAGMRALLEAAKVAARLDVERRRIELADDSLSLFEELMRLRTDFIEGHFERLATGGQSYRVHAVSLGAKWSDAFAFTRTPWAPDTVYASYYDAFQKPSFAAMTKVAQTQDILSVSRVFRYRPERADVPDLAPAASAFDDSGWKSTDVGLDSWSRLGLHDWFGSMWYRATIHARSLGGKRTFLWLSSVDGSVRVFVNGKEARYAPDETAPPKAVSGGGPLRFDVTDLVADGVNMVAISARRTALNELGVGGLTGPVVLSRER